MIFKKLKKEYPAFFARIPDKIIDLVSAEETALQVSEICLENGVEDEEKIEKIAYQITFVLLGRLPPNELTEVLEKKAQLETDIAQKIYLETSRLIFASVKDDLTQLYEEEGLPPATEKTMPLPKEEVKKPPGKDVYRELVE